MSPGKPVRGEPMGCYPREKLAWQGSGQAKKELSRCSSGEEFFMTSQSLKEEET